MENVQMTLQKAEQDKQMKDTQIRTLNEETARQNESIARMGKDKKAMDETIKTTQSALAAEEDKCNHLNKLKQKLEQNLDEVSLHTFCPHCMIRHRPTPLFLKAFFKIIYYIYLHIIQTSYYSNYCYHVVITFNNHIFVVCSFVPLGINIFALKLLA